MRALQPRRGRPRDVSYDAAILDATLDLVADVGFAGLTIDAVAARAKVGKASIYRRWASKEALLLEAWAACAAPLPEPDTGTLRGDLAAMFNHVNHGRPDEVMRRLFPQMIAAAKVNPEVGDSYRAFIDDRRGPLQRVLARAAERGELPPDLDRALLHDLLVAPLVYRWMVSDGDVGPATVEAIVNVVLAGVAATQPTPTAAR